MECEASHLQPKRSKQSNHTWSYKIPFLPVELIIEILSRLPVESLLKFRCVSRSWRYLISSPKFIESHLKLRTNNKDSTHHRLLLTFFHTECHLMDCSIRSLLYDPIPKLFRKSDPMQNPREYVTILGSVNGLICLSIKRDLIIWNPSIKKFKKFRDPQSRYYLSYGFRYHYFLHGFGYDRLHDDYKIVLISDAPKKVRIYSTNSDSWTITRHDRSCDFSREKRGIFVNGKLHWANFSSQDTLSYNGWDIISIDVTDGKWGKVEKPFQEEGDFDLMPCVGVLGSDFSMLCNNRSLQTDVWIMKEYGIKKSWTKLYTINRPHDLPEEYDFSPLFYKMSNKGEILLRGSQSTFMICDTKNDSIICENFINICLLVEACIYINESLVWPFSQKGRTTKSKKENKDSTTTKVGNPK